MVESPECISELLIGGHSMEELDDFKFFCRLSAQQRTFSILNHMMRNNTTLRTILDFSFNFTQHRQWFLSVILSLTNFLAAFAHIVCGESSSSQHFPNFSTKKHPHQHQSPHWFSWPSTAFTQITKRSRAPVILTSYVAHLPHNLWTFLRPTPFNSSAGTIECGRSLRNSWTCCFTDS